jgi:hypothetical protein
MPLENGYKGRPYVTDYRFYVGKSRAADYISTSVTLSRSPEVYGSLIVRDFGPHIVLLDYHLAGFDGPYAALTIKQRFPQVKNGFLGGKLRLTAVGPRQQYSVQHLP